MGEEVCIKSDEGSVSSKHIEIKQTEDALQCAPRSKLLEVLIYLNKAEEKRLLENFVDSNAVVKA